MPCSSVAVAQVLNPTRYKKNSLHHTRQNATLNLQVYMSKYKFIYIYVISPFSIHFVSLPDTHF